MLVLHLRYLGKESLAHRVYQEQLAMGWPGLAPEVEDICKELKIENANTTTCNRTDYKQILIQACHISNEAILRKLAEGKEKCFRMTSERYGVKAYLEEKNILEVRNIYRSRFGQRPFAGNFSNDNQDRKSNWMCQCGISKEKEKHLTSENCPVYSDIRAQFQGFEKDEDLVSYFNQVLERRDRLNALEQDETDFYG